MKRSGGKLIIGQHGASGTDEIGTAGIQNRLGLFPAAHAAHSHDGNAPGGLLANALRQVKAPVKGEAFRRLHEAVHARRYVQPMDAGLNIAFSDPAALLKIRVVAAHAHGDDEVIAAGRVDILNYFAGQAGAPFGRAALRRPPRPRGPEAPPG